MFTQSVHSSLEMTLEEPLAFRRWCGDNPDVDRSAPPRPAASSKKKAAKKKPAARKPAKRK